MCELNLKTKWMDAPDLHLGGTHIPSQKHSRKWCWIGRI